MARKRLPSLLVAPGELPHYILLPGDPARAAFIADHLSQPKEIAKNREFHSYRGFYRDVPVGIVSTGVGAPGAAICAEEVIRAGAKVLIRVGTAGALQDHLKDGDLVVALGAARCDGTTPRLLPIEFPALSDPEVTAALWEHAIRKELRVHRGVVVTLDAFYRGVLDLGLDAYAKAGALAVEMECATIFCVAALRGAKAGAILAIDGDARQATVGEYNPHREVVHRAIEREIEVALEAIVQLSSEEVKQGKMST